MRIDTGPHLQLEQRQKLAPRMIQSMEILQMPATALQERVDQELAANPTLELREETEEDAASADGESEASPAAETEEEPSPGEAEERERAEEFERFQSLVDEESAPPSRTRGGDDEERDGKLEAMENTAARPEPLAEQLRRQWRLVEKTPAEDAAGQYLIELLDADGYLRLPWEQVVTGAPDGVDGNALSAALEKLKRNLEPAGLGAADLRECLLLQIDAWLEQEPDADILAARRLVEDHLEDIEANRLPRIAERTGLSIEEVKRAVAELRHFHPHPGRMLAPDASPSITPDARVYYDEEADHYRIELTGQGVPSLAINARYRAMAKDRSLAKDDRSFLQSHLRSARWLIDALEQRQSTLYRVIELVVEEQRGFLDHGEQALKPLPMTHVAERLGVHVATVSRAVHEKYVETPQGIVPLRMFFSGGTATESGDQMSWAAVQAKLREIIDGEDKTQPLSDDRLAEQLREAGIDISRRTVAKYRKQMQIPSARQRKEF